MVILGTRPEAIKLCPLVLALRERPDLFQVHLCSTGQHRELLEPVWECFGVEPDSRLESMRAGQSLAESAGRILTMLPPVFEAFQPRLAVVQGDTTTTFCGALAAFYQRVPVAQVEAGLRSGDLSAPFPEELNRSLVSRFAALHFAATAEGKRNLLREGVPESQIHITGNTGIDALLRICRSLDSGALSPPVAFPAATRPRVLVTMHRREALESGMPALCRALRRLVNACDVEIVFPMHPNPQVREVIARELPPHERILRSEPLDYVSFVALMRQSAVALTDSGGIQEEAPYLGLPVVVLRETTERPEGVEAGLARLAGFDPEAIYAACRDALFSGDFKRPENASHAIYGDGAASARIRSLIASYFES